MTINGNCRSLLIGGVAVMAGLALAGCNRDSSASTANAPAPAPAATANTANPVESPPPSPADASAQVADGVGNEVADMERHHKQGMDHAEMRAGATEPDVTPPTDSPSMPMKDM